MPISFPNRTKQRQPQRPAMFHEWSGRFPKQDGAIASAIKNLADGYGQVFEAVHQAAADTTLTEGAKLVRSAKAARAKLEPLFDALDGANATSGAHAKQIEYKLRQIYQPDNPHYATVARHQEIRSLFRSMPRGDRHAALTEAEKAGDEDTIIALAGVQPFLSGIAPEMQAAARDYLIERHAPDEAAMLKAIREQQSLAEGFRNEMLTSMGELVDFAKADELVALSAQDTAAA